MELRVKTFDDPSQWLWTDLPIPVAMERARALTLRTPIETLAGWTTDGYAVIPDAVTPAAIDGFGSDLAAALADPAVPVSMTFWDRDGHHHEPAAPHLLAKREAKVLDLHAKLPSALALVFSPPILDFLTDIFQADAVAFQSLYFEYGSQQGAHQDSAFVYTRPAMHFAASWIALEDVAPGAGELFYYPKSQRLDDIIFASGTKALRPGDPDGNHYSQRLAQFTESKGMRRAHFHGKRGGALMWAADLVHGGEPIRAAHTRRSLVTHYCPLGAEIPYAAGAGMAPRQVGPRAWVLAAN